MKKIIILGGTGLVGQALKNFWQDRYQVELHGRAAFVSENNLTHLIDGADIVLQLAGANIGNRWHKGYEQELIDSRVKTTALLNRALAKCERLPQHILAASAIGFYPQTLNCQTPHDETQTEPGDDFLAQLSVQWEN